MRGGWQAEDYKVIDPKEEEIQKRVNEMLRLFKKMDEYIFSPSYRIICTLNNYLEDEDEDNSLLSGLQ